MLCYIAAQPERMFSRGQLAEFFWSDSTELEGRQSVAAALERLRQTLPVWPLRLAGEAVGWDADADLFTDTSHFLALARLGREEPRPEANNTALRALHETVSLWRGSFLQAMDSPGGQFLEWLTDQRRQWEDRLLDVMDRLVNAEARLGNWKNAAGFARRALAVDSLQERFHRTLMLATYHLGDQVGAIAQFHACEKVLRERLGVEPEAETRSLRDLISSWQIEPGQVWEPKAPAVTGTSARSAPASASERTPLVGRQTELESLRQTLAMAIGGKGRLILVQGEPGIGKTRLVEELLRDPRLPAMTLLRGHAYESLNYLHYAPFVEALGRILPTLDLTALNLPDYWLAEVHRLVPDHAGSAVPVPGQQPDEDFHEQRRLFEGIARFLAALPRPLVFVLEDIQWLDDASLLLMTYLFRQPYLAHLSLIATARAGDLPEQLQGLLYQWQREDRVATLTLGELPLEAVAALTEAIAGERLPQLGIRLYRETQGNPLFTVEFLRHLREAQAWEFQTGAGTGDLPIPGTVQAVIRQRVSRLPRAPMELLRAASIFPAPVPLNVLRHVSGMSEEATADALDALLRSGLLVEKRYESVAVSFSHDLVRRVVRSDLSQARLIRLHRFAFELLQSRDGGRDRIAEHLAHHATAAEMWEEGLEWSLRAAANAEAVFAYPAAAGFLEQALVCIERLPSAPELRRRALNIRLQLSRLGHFFQPGRLDEWLPPTAADTAADLGDADLISQVWLARSNALTVQGRLLLARPMFERLLPVARMSRSKTLLIPILTVLGGLHGLVGRHAKAVDMLSEAIGLTEDAGLFAIYAGATRAGILATIGDFERAEPDAREYTRRAREMGDPALRGFTMGIASCVYYFQGRWEASVACSQEAMEQARQGGAHLHEYIARVWLGLSLARLGDPQAALEAQREAISLSGAARTVMLLDRVHIMLGELYLESGLLAEAETEVRTGMQIAAANEYRFGAALGTKVLGLISASRGRHREAKIRVREALVQFSEIGAGPEIARCHAILTLLEDTKAEREKHGSRAEELFRLMKMEWDLAALRKSRLSGLGTTG